MFLHNNILSTCKRTHAHMHRQVQLHVGAISYKTVAAQKFVTRGGSCYYTLLCMTNKAMKTSETTFDCVVCHEQGLERRKMAKTPCVARHGYVSCKACLIHWFSYKLTCPLCAQPAPISSCLRKTDLLARRKLRADRLAVKRETAAQQVQQNEEAARQLQREEVQSYYESLLRGQ